MSEAPSPDRPTAASGPATTNGPATAGGVIHDLGYRHYDGVRLGRGAVFRALYVSSLRSAFGLGRGAKAKIIPFLAIGIVAIPAVVTVAAKTLFRDAAGIDFEFIPYRGYAFSLQLVIVGFLAIQAAEMVCRDLRFNVLPLYFSRPIQRSDYPLAKLAALATALLIVMGTPLTMHYLAAVFTTTTGLDGIWSETKQVAPVVVSVAVHALVLAALGLAIASMTPRRPFAIGGVAAWYVVSNAIMGTLFGVQESTSTGGQSGEWPALVSPFGMLSGFQNAVFGLEPFPVNARNFEWLFITVTVLFFAACLGVLLFRYRRVGR